MGEPIIQEVVMPISSIMGLGKDALTVTHKLQDLKTECENGESVLSDSFHEKFNALIEATNKLNDTAVDFVDSASDRVQQIINQMEALHDVDENNVVDADVTEVTNN